MKKSGLNKSHKWSGTDISLIIILAFCSLVIVFIGYTCCRRRRAKRKKKSEQRKIVKGGRRPENVELLGSSQQSSESLDLEGQGSNTTGQPSSEENPENKRKKSHTSSQNPNDRSFLSWIMSALCRGGGSTSDSDEASNKIDSNGASTSKQDSPRTRSKGTSKKGNRSPVMLELEDLDDSKSRKTDKDLKNGSVAKSDSSVVNSQRTPTDVDPLKPKTKTGQLAGIGRDKGEGGKGKNKSNSKSAKRGDCSRNCTGRACKRCGAFKNNDDDDGGYDDDDGNNDGGNYELLAKRRTDQGSSKHEKQGARKDEGRGRSDKRSEAVAHQTRSQANPGKKSERTVKAWIQGSLDDDDSYERNVDTDYDMCREYDNDKAKGNTPMDVDEEQHVIKEIADALESDVRTRDEMEIDKQDKPTMPRNEASLGQHGNASGGTIERFMEEKRIESIGEIFNVMQYARKEWKSETATAQAVREGYFQIPHQLGLSNLRVIRGDNYCAIRATLFQVLAKKIPILSQLGKIEELPQELMSSGIDWIDEWNFASRLRVERSKVCDEIKVCLKELSSLVDLNAQMCHEEGRVTHLLSKFNFTPLEYEIRWLEAVKFLMLYRAIQLHRKVKANEDVPIFAMIMFARDTSQDAWHFMAKHLNAVGDTGGLEQVEMHLLGYTLGVTIKVVRPSHFGQPDFIASYPEDMPDGTQVVSLVAEDDRHYNILS